MSIEHSCRCFEKTRVGVAMFASSNRFVVCSCQHLNAVGICARDDSDGLWSKRGGRRHLVEMEPNWR